MKGKVLKKAALGIALGACIATMAPLAMAQSATGAVAGRASAGDQITITNTATGASRTVTSTIDFTGGTVAVTGDIVRTGGAGTENATVTLDGASLNMSGKNIGVSGTTINFAAQSGTLTNLAELNGGGIFTKTTTGTLILGAGNAYTGATNVSDGTLQVGLGGTGVTGTGLITAVKIAATYGDAPITLSAIRRLNELWRAKFASLGATLPTRPNNSLRPSSRLRKGMPRLATMAARARALISAILTPVGQTSLQTRQPEQ